MFLVEIAPEAKGDLMGAEGHVAGAGFLSADDEMASLNFVARSKRASEQA